MTPEEEFFEAFGRAIAQWQSIEYHLGHIFAWSVQSSRLWTIEKGFATISTFRDKIQVLDVILTDVLTDPKLQAAWLSLKNRLNRLAKKRNFLAHAHILYLPEDKVYLAAPPIPKITIETLGKDRLKLTRNTHQIKQLNTAFGLASKQTGTFYKCLITKAAQPQQSEESS